MPKCRVQSCDFGSRSIRSHVCLDLDLISAAGSRLLDADNSRFTLLECNKRMETSIQECRVLSSRMTAELRQNHLHSTYSVLRASQGLGKR